MNRAKLYQLVLFPMNNGATNVYYILTLNFIAYYANGVLGLLLMFATTMVTVMRLLDAVTDPIIGALIDRTSTKFGKFRPFMVLGNVIMIVSSICLYFGTRLISGEMSWLRYVCFVLFYALYVIGYTFQTACTRSGQTCLTNDPKQRPLFTIFNTVASLIGMGLVQFLAPILSKRLGGYNSAEFFNVMIPLAIVVSALLTLLAVVGIWVYSNRACDVYRSTGTSRFVEAGQSGMESESGTGEFIYRSVCDILWGWLWSVLLYSRYADSDGCRLFRL